MTKQAPKPALIYCRSASVPQNDATVINEQEQQCRTWAAEMGYHVQSAYRDAGYSGMNMNRPGLHSLLAAWVTSATPHAVIIADRTRLSRNPVEWPTIIETFKDLNTELQIVAEMPTAASA